MNGTATAPAVSLPKEEEPVVTGIESEDVAAGSAANGTGVMPIESNNPFAASAERLSSSLSGLGFGRASAPASRPRTPNSGLGRERLEEDAVDSSPLARRNELSVQAFARDSAFRDAF